MKKFKFLKFEVINYDRSKVEGMKNKGKNYINRKWMDWAWMVCSLIVDLTSSKLFYLNLSKKIALKIKIHFKKSRFSGPQS